MKRIILFFIYSILSVTTSSSQNLVLSTLTDSVKVGEVFSVSVTFTHNEKEQLFFPTKESDFRKFEFVKKQTFRSIYTPDSLVKDSVSYYLRTFEVTDSLPLFFGLYKGADSVEVRSNVKWIYLKDGLINGKGNELLIDNSYLEIPFLWDEHLLYFLLFILVGIGLYLSLIWLPKYLKKKRIERFVSSHQVFVNNYNYHSGYTHEAWSRFFTAWKKDISKSLNKNVAGYTTRKLSKYLKANELQPVFKKLERILYDPSSKEILTEDDFVALKRASQIRFETRLKALKNDE